MSDAYYCCERGEIEIKIRNSGTKNDLTRSNCIRFYATVLYDKIPEKERYSSKKPIAIRKKIQYAGVSRTPPKLEVFNCQFGTFVGRYF